MKELYPMIFKRKSMRKFDQSLHVSEAELSAIERQTQRLMPLTDDIPVKTALVKREQTTAKYGEYCLLFYSEKKPHYLLNAGYMLQQMDLFLASLDIGACWYGMAKTKEKRLDGLDYVIMLALGKSRPQDFRSDSAQFRRKSAEAVWTGDFDDDVTEAVRLAPSACNSQPWRFVSDANRISVYRDTAAWSIIPPGKKSFFNTINMGINLCCLESALLHKGYAFDRTLVQAQDAKSGLLKIAEYQLTPPLIL